MAGDGSCKVGLYQVLWEPQGEQGSQRGKTSQGTSDPEVEVELTS